MVSALGTASYWNDSFGKKLQGKSITATGAPTIEQLQASYGKLDLSSGSVELDNTNTLYFPHDDHVFSDEGCDCSGYWLASPNPNDEREVWYTDYSGWVECGGGYSVCGSAARPVVCLPSGISGTITGTTLNIDAE